MYRCPKEPKPVKAEASRYIPEQVKGIQPHSQGSRYIPERQKQNRSLTMKKGKKCLSIGSMGELISRSMKEMKGTMGTMKRIGSGDLADAGQSLNR